MLLSLLMLLIMMMFVVLIITSSIKLAEYLAKQGYGNFVQLAAYITSIVLQTVGLTLVFLGTLLQ